MSRLSRYMATVFENRIIAFDSFNRQDTVNTLGIADTGQSWENLQGVCRITSNKAGYVSQGAGGVALAAIDCAAADVKLTATLKIVSNCGIAFRCQDAANYLVVRASVTDILLASVAGNSGTTLATYDYPASAGTEYSLSIVAKGSSIKVYLSDALIIDVTSANYQTKTQHGIRCIGEGETADNFIVEAV